MSRKLRVLIVGGYGTFGGRLVELIEHDSRLTLVVAGRSRAKAETYCQARGKTEAALIGAAFDRNGDLDEQLARIGPDVVVDASGPFQAYGEHSYALVQACIAKRIHYLDLADGSDFVAGVAAFDAAAREQGVVVLSGVSTYPVLSAAALRRLTKDMVRVERISAGIAPSPFAGVGENVIRAIASYGGKRIALRRKGKDAFGYPFTEQMRFTIAPPGGVPTKRILFSLIDVPDLRLLGGAWPEATIWAGAGPVPEALHRVLIAFAWLVRLRVLRSLSPLAQWMVFASNRLRWGEHRGGMFVEAQGANAHGALLTRSWHLVAEGNDGPFIPSMPAAAIVKRILDDTAPPPGARAATRELELDDYEPFFARLRITTGIRATVEGNVPLYRRVLGEAWTRLPAEIAAMHQIDDARLVEGRAVIERGKGLVANLIALLFGFPKAGVDVPTQVWFTASRGMETWTRSFGGKLLSSRQYEGWRRSQHLLCERFGPVVFAMALVVDEQKLRLVLRRWSVLGVPMPMWLSPRADAFEAVEDGRFRFHVEIRMPIIGLLVRYRGWLRAPGDE